MARKGPELTAQLLGDNLPPNAGLLDLGRHRLRDFPHAQHIFQLSHPDLPAAFPPVRAPEAMETPAILVSSIEPASAAALHHRLLTRTCGPGRPVRSVGAENVSAVDFPDAPAAIRAAVRLQRATERHNRSHDDRPIAVRVAVHPGSSPIADDDLASAARVCHEARPGQVLVANVSQASAAGDGVTQVPWRPSAPAPLPAALAVEERGPFVGRDGDLDRLLGVWRGAVDDGVPRVVLVGGEAGIGKSRLARELARTVQRAGSSVVLGRCDPDVVRPFQPFVESLRDVMNLLDDGLRHELPPGTDEQLARLVPGTASTEAPGSPPVGPEPLGQQYRLFEAVVDLLQTVTLDVDLVVVFEDLQWADQSTLRLLGHIAGELHSGPIVVVGTYRSDEVAADHPLGLLMADLQRQTGFEKITLSGLSPPAARALVEGLAGGLAARRPSTVPALIARAEGNPLFLQELVRSEAQRDACGAEPEPIVVPESIRQLVNRRISLLSERTRRMLLTAAVIGTEFSTQVLERAGDVHGDALLDALEEAARLGIVLNASDSPEVLSFSHALVRDALYDCVLPVRRLRLHRRVALVLEEMAAAGTDVAAAQLSHHFFLSGTDGEYVERAVRYAIRAGEQATAALAYDEAVAQYRRAVEAWDRVPDADEHARCDVLIALGAAERRAGDPAHRATLLDAGRRAEALGDGERMALAALTSSRGFWSSSLAVDDDRVGALRRALARVGPGDSALRARLLATLAVELVFGADYDEIRRLSDEALAMAHRLGDPVTLANVLVPRYNTIRGDPATLDERLANTAELVEVTRGFGDRGIEVFAGGWRALALLEAGRWDEAMRLFDEFAGATETLREPTLSWYARYLQASLLLFRGRFDEADRRSVEAYRLGHAAGHPDAELFLLCQRVQLALDSEQPARVHDLVAPIAGRQSVPSWELLALSQLDRDEEARRLLDDVATNDFEGATFHPTWLHAMTNYAAACAHLRDARRAAVLYERIRPFADQIVTMSSLTYSGSASYYVGLLAGTVGRLDEAEQALRRAVDVHIRIAAPAWLARTKLELGRLLLEGGDRSRRSEAAGLLEEAAAGAGHLGMAITSRRARSLVDRMVAASA